MVDIQDELSFKLPARTIEELSKMEKSIKSTRKMMESLRGMGIDVSDIQSKLDWAEETRKVLLKDFS